MGNVNASSRNRSCVDCGKLFWFLKKTDGGNENSEEAETFIVRYPAEAMRAACVVQFPQELMMEILSWLPLKSLIRAQLVCKEWRALIQDHQFMEKHMEHSSYVRLWYNATNSTPAGGGGGVPLWYTVWRNVISSGGGQSSDFTYIHGCDGLLLMKKIGTQMHLLWNPATRLVLELPIPLHNANYGFGLSFVPATKNYKIASFFRDEDSGQHGCQVVTLGRSMEWRRLTFPAVAVAVAVHSKQQGSVVTAGGAVHYCVDAEIVTFDVETELLTLSRLPPDIFSDVESVKAIDCDGKLGFAVIIGRDLQLMVLRDYKNNRWCKDKQVIPLPFLQDEGSAVILLIKLGEIWLLLQNENIHVYTIETGKLRFFQRCKGFALLSSKLYNYKPSLVSFEGMRRADAGLEVYQPRDLHLD